MELVAFDIVISPPPSRRASHNRRSAAERDMRLALANALAPIVSRLSTETVRLKLGDSERSAGNTRDDIGHVKARRVGEIGLSRLLWMCECLDIDAWAVIAGSSPRRLAS